MRKVDLENLWVYTAVSIALWILIQGTMEVIWFEGDLLSATIQRLLAVPHSVSFSAGPNETSDSSTGVREDEATDAQQRADDEQGQYESVCTVFVRIAVHSSIQRHDDDQTPREHGRPFG